MALKTEGLPWDSACFQSFVIGMPHDNNDTSPSSGRKVVCYPVNTINPSFEHVRPFQPVGGSYCGTGT